ncbi:MAG: hypothetical protein AAFV53_16220 [Myxococcota bacterium]
MKGSWGFIALLFIGCANKTRNMASETEGNFLLGRPSTAWERQPAGGADYAWVNAAQMSTIYADSNCKRHFQDARLPDLLTHLTAGIAKGPPVREEQMTLDQRAALMRVYNGVLDGVPVRMGAVVINKDECTYDVVYVAPPNRFEEGWADFVTVMSGFRTTGPR